MLLSSRYVDLDYKKFYNRYITTSFYDRENDKSNIEIDSRKEPTFKGLTYYIISLSIRYRDSSKF